MAVPVAAAAPRRQAKRASLFRKTTMAEARRWEAGRDRLGLLVEAARAPENPAAAPPAGVVPGGQTAVFRTRTIQVAGAVDNRHVTRPRRRWRVRFEPVP